MIPKYSSLSMLEEVVLDGEMETAISADMASEVEKRKKKKRRNGKEDSPADAEMGECKPLLQFDVATGKLEFRRDQE